MAVDVGPKVAAERAPVRQPERAPVLQPERTSDLKAEVGVALAASSAAPVSTFPMPALDEIAGAEVNAIHSGPSAQTGCVSSPLHESASKNCVSPRGLSAITPKPAMSTAGKSTEQPPVRTVIKEAIKEIKAGAGAGAFTLASAFSALRNKRPINVKLDQLLSALFFAWLASQLLLIKVIHPSPWWLTVSCVLGVFLGLLFSFLYYNNRKLKAEACQVLDSNIGLKGLQFMLGSLPSWLSYTEREKIAWMNNLLEEVWPFYDKAVCKHVKQQAEGVFEQALITGKVPGIKSVGFKQLTFGDAPFRVESIFVSDRHKDAMVLEMDVRWCGQANITLAIELAAGEFAKMCPRVTDISFVGSLRVTLKPLVQQVPCFGAAVVTFRKPPCVKYNLNFGSALGGQYAALVVKPFINNVINSNIINTLVWPQRLVVPIITTEEMQVEIAKLAYRSQGLLKVKVIQAKDLPKADTFGSSDPFCELMTDGTHTESTTCIKNNLNPVWNEEFWLLVQEPYSQEMQVTMYDRDMFSAKELLSLNVKQAIGAKELLGRCLVKLADVCAAEPECTTHWYHLGMGDFSLAEGPGKGAGRIQMSCMYRSFDSFQKDEPAGAEYGIVVLRIVQASQLAHSSVQRRGLTAYVRVKCGSESAIVPPLLSKDIHHRWTNRNVIEFYHTKCTSDVKIKVVEKALQDETLGRLDIPISDIATSSDFNPLTGKNEAGFMLRSMKLEDSDTGVLTFSLRFVPMI